MSFDKHVLDALNKDLGAVFIIGTETNYPLSNIVNEDQIVPVKGIVTNINYIYDLLKSNFKINILRIGDGIDPIIIFNYYYGLVSDNGIIIIDNYKEFQSRLDWMIIDGKIPNNISTLGTYTTIYHADNQIIIRKNPTVSNIPLGIVIATYYRKNGKSKEYVERSLDSISKQTYQNFKVFLIGDKYENQEEFDYFSTLLPSDKLVAINLPIALERENCKIPQNLWNIGGANAVNYGLELALKQGFTHYVHLDDDDYWHCFHLRNIATAYQQFPEAYFVCTMAIMPDLNILPVVNNYGYDNFACVGGQVFHSAYGFRLDKIPFKYITLTLDESEPIFPPADADMLYRIGQYCQNNGYKTIAIPIISCFHDSQWGIFAEVDQILKENESVDDLLITQIKRSNSHLIVDTISKQMEGHTFHHHYHLLYDLRTILGRQPKNYLEIGVFNGGSLSLMLQHPYDTNLIGLDLFMFEGQYETVQQNIAKFNRYGRNVLTYKGDTHQSELINKLKEQNYKVDILFIDGDHSKAGAILDFEMYSPLVNSGGYVVFDDYHDHLHSPEVKLAVDEIVENIKQGKYGEYEIIGSPENFLQVYPQSLTHYNEFIIRKK